MLPGRRIAHEATAKSSFPSLDIGSEFSPSWFSAELMFPEILHEDNHVIIVNKPAGLLTQGDISGEPSLLEGLKYHIKQRDGKPGNVYLGMVHRLDRPVSGVIVFAKTSKAARRLSECIRKRKMFKVYLALTSVADTAGGTIGTWREFTHDLMRVRDKTVVTERPGEYTQQGVLRLKTLYSNHSRSLHLVHLVTGRKHQIRAQLSHLGLPICGDRKYGSGEVHGTNKGIALHAYYCSVKHPVKEEKLAVLADASHGFLEGFGSGEERHIHLLLDEELGHI